MRNAHEKGIVTMGIYEKTKTKKQKCEADSNTKP